MNRMLLCFLCLFTASMFAQKDSVSVKDEKKVKLVGIPIINYSNSFGASFGGFGSAYYNVSATDTISPLSSSGLFGTYSTNKTWFAAQINKFYFKEDTFRLKTAMGAGTINFQTFIGWPNIISDIPYFGGLSDSQTEDDGVFVDYQTKVFFAYVELLYNVYKKLYVGPQFVYSHNNTTFESIFIPSEEISQFGFGVSLVYDTRDNQFAPLDGFHAKANTMSFSENIGSTNSYTRLNLVYNHYFPIGEENTVLARFYSDLSMGDVPFSGQNVVGRDDLRGYSEGKYRGDQVYAVQSEYRHWFADRWGFVTFAGVATAVDKVDEMRFDNLLPAAGAGIRFKALPKQRINVGIDVAVGKDDWGLYFRIGEAFTR